MNLQEAMEALKPFAPMVPRVALEWIETHWDEAGPLLLAELDAQLAAPTAVETDARFLYALHVCADRRCPDAFPRYLALCRLPNVVLDDVLGDILTEGMPQMLARTCAGRIGDLQALVEDACPNVFARGTAMEALLILAQDGAVSREWLADYCVQLLRNKLERRGTHVWDVVVGVAADIQAEGALPLIEKAYERGLADHGCCDLAYIQEQFSMPPGDLPETTHRHGGAWLGVERAMAFFVSRWGENPPRDDSQTFLKVLERHRGERARELVPSVGRNEPCPCGSGLKFKKCCMAKSVAQVAPSESARGLPIPEEHRTASDWMEAGYLQLAEYKSRAAMVCWRECWKELRSRLPPSLTDPADAEESGAFEGYERLDTWMEDVQELLLDMMDKNVDAAEWMVTHVREVLARFPDMENGLRMAYKADCARALGYLGRREAAVAEAEALIAEAPDKALGYSLLADMRGEDAIGFNMPLDVPGAIACLETALQRADDCGAYILREHLQELKEWHQTMQEPM